MTIKDGPLTERQDEVLHRICSGEQYPLIALRMGLSLSVVKQAALTARVKMGCKTPQQAAARYATAKAYRNAAAQVLSGRAAVPVDETEGHVNYVLEGLAGLLRDWSDQRLPK